MLRLYASLMVVSIDILPTTQVGGFLSSPRGFPASSNRARVGFHRPWSYRLSTGSHGQSRRQNVFCGLGEVLVIQASVLVIEGVCLLAQSPIVDEATAAESASKHLLLLVRWVHAVLVGAFLFPVLQDSRYGVNCQGGSLGGTCPPQPPSKERASYPQC